MELQVLGSSSSGNGYIIDTGTHALLIEAGVGMTEIKKAVNYDISRIDACIITHEHGDHAAHTQSILNAQIPVYASAGTLGAIGIKKTSYLQHSMQAYKWHRIGEFYILPFPVHHDAAEPFGYYIHHEEMGNLLFITDFSRTDEESLPANMDVDHLLIECNYSEPILAENTLAGKISIQRRNRVIQNHCSLEICKEIISEEIQEGWTKNVVLLHLSDDNSDPAAFLDEVGQITSATTYIAHKGLKITINKD